MILFSGAMLKKNARDLDACINSSVWLNTRTKLCLRRQHVDVAPHLKHVMHFYEKKLIPIYENRFKRILSCAFEFCLSYHH